MGVIGPVEVLEDLLCKYVLDAGDLGPGEVGVAGPVKFFETFAVVGFTGLAKYVLLVLPNVNGGGVLGPLFTDPEEEFLLLYSFL